MIAVINLSAVAAKLEKCEVKQQTIL